MRKKLKGEYAALITAAEATKSIRGLPMLRWCLVVLEKGQMEIVHKCSGLSTSAGMALAKGDLETLSLCAPKNLFDLAKWNEILKHSIEKRVRIAIQLRTDFQLVYFLEEIKEA